MAITENRIEEMLRDAVFTDNAHKETLRKRFRTDIVELGRDDLEMVAGGVDFIGDFRLIGESPDEWNKWE